ncbi:MAG TPA: prenyltransferase/squalene oxidase repeat-containing protein [Solirubrobacteraceae bacterium]
MTWQLASFAVLAAALAAGFAWYERAHPSSKVLALVATLAALAALGRVAFAPLPNVKPTTDIVLLSGFALGGAPGFAVGAIAALASNVVFGQGPWTPWQMGAWGLVGLAGAGLGAASGRRMGRIPLAAACGAAGLLYGAILDYSTWVTFSGPRTLSGYLAFSATSLSFNIAHAVGNVLFCLAFGPAFVRALLRFRERFEVRWEPVAAALVAGLVLVAAPAAARAASPAAYLISAQNRDGGFGAAKGDASTQPYSAWAAMGLAAAGHHNPRVARYLAAGAPRMRDVGDIERTILGLVAQRASPRRAHGTDLVARLLRARRRNGSWDGLVNRTAFAVLALRAVHTGDRQVRSAVRWLGGQANRDGGFNFAGRGGPSGIDDTAGVVQALAAAGHRRGPTVRKAVRFLLAHQNPDGGFPLQPGAGSNAQSTAWAIQAFVAAERDPARVIHGGSRSPLAYVRSLTAGDGSVRYSRTSRQTPVWVTAQALTAIHRRTFPIVPR